ncbi:MAG TPA: type I methionyl aminopeptidase [Candidatus Eisenbacteria bacterium]|jgi:methionyl aminopeptidase|nr:type I methionyl aminopeptidase [Candidatus Eisenbacteria bacterium]
MGGILLKSKAELEIMRRAGRVVAGLLKLMEREAKAGVSTKRLDEIAEAYIRSQGTEPAFKGYYGYPACICASVNEEVVHGIPGSRVLKDGDIIGVDVGVKLEGFYSDAARTFAIGAVDERSRRLIEVTREAMQRGIQKAVRGNRLSDISWAVQSYAEQQGFSVVRQFVGHGIGRSLHEEPQVPNYGKPGQGPELVIGMALAIEPMLNAGTHEVEILKDGWTVVTRDRKRSGHFEQTVFVGETEPEIVTEKDA